MNLKGAGINPQSRKGLTETKTWPMYVWGCRNQHHPLLSMIIPSHTYISAFSKRFFRFSLIASLDILLIRVRSETPTSFFLVLSKTAFLICGWPPLLEALALPVLPAVSVCFLRPARFVTAYSRVSTSTPKQKANNDSQGAYHCYQSRITPETLSFGQVEKGPCMYFCLHRVQGWMLTHWLAH